MKNKIEDLRNHLFAELEDLRDPDKKFDATRTRAVIDVSQTIINTAKAETDFLAVAGKAGQGTGFIPQEPRPAPALGQHKPAIAHEG